MGIRMGFFIELFNSFLAYYSGDQYKILTNDNKVKFLYSSILIKN